jgi:hypothetical protein
MQGWRLGGTHLVELTVVPQDRERLACASDGHFDAVRCGFGADKKPVATPVESTLSPYKTVGNDTVLGAGLWTSPGLSKLPRGRFTVVCNFHVLGVLKSVATRWDKDGAFQREKHGLPVGRFENCAIPQ